MKLITLAASALLATSAAARSTGFLHSSADVSTQEQYSVPGENPLEHCDDPADDLLIIKKVDISPNPPQAGKNLTITAEGDLLRDVEEGAYAHLEVKYGLIKLISQKADLCETVKNVDLECPLKKGPLKLTKVIELPKAIPPGHYNVLADVYNQDEDKLTCLRSSITFGRNSVAGLFKQDM